jgi:hypothetical protein
MLMAILFVVAAGGLSAGLGMLVNGWLGAGFFAGVVVGALFGSVNAGRVNAAKQAAKDKVREIAERHG